MGNIFDRLQFVKHEEIFATREEAYNYVINKQIFERPSLAAEPMILLYESNDAEKGPNVILAIGSVGNGVDSSTDNRTFFIDTQKTEEEIEELRELIEQAIKSLEIIPVDSDTLDLSIEKVDEAIFLSGDVKIADYTIASGKVQNNIITVEEGKGLYAFVDMDYDPETLVITFNVNGVIKNFQLPPDQHVEKGWYSPADEALFLKLADGSKVKIDVVKLIDEWTVLSSASTTPIMLFKEHISSYTESHDGVYDWQDLLTADVRVADHINDNILHKDRTGRYLYVKGTADNIKYKNGLTVADALDNIDTKVSTSAGNMIYRRPDGLFASAMLDYNSAENKLIYRYTDAQTEDFKEVSFTLNSVKILQDITYDPVKEVIVIRYIDAQGEYQRVEIPAKDIIEEWVVNNEAHNIELVKYRSEGQGKDILSADAKIHAGDNNILEDKDHKLYVNGISNNIKYDVTGNITVKGVLDELSNKDIETNARIDVEIERATSAEEALGEKIEQEIADRIAYVDDEKNRAIAVEKVLDDKIGTGFTDDPHENVTAKYNELIEVIDSEIERASGAENSLENSISSESERAVAKENELSNAIEAEATRATNAETVIEGKVEAIETIIGDGFGPRNTVRDEIDAEKSERVAADNLLSSAIDTLSDNIDGKLSDITSIDRSINIDKENPTTPDLSVNISSEIEDNKPNIIKLNADGLYAGVDLSYSAESNTLIFNTTNGSKNIQLDSISSIISIEYIPSLEVIRITYLANGHEVKTTDVPVGDLINEWRVEDGHPHAVQLEKVRIASGTSEQDILKASVIITDDHDDNVLVMDDGALYVSGAQISANTAAIATEVNRAIAAEQALDAKIDQEIADREADADAEETRAKAVEAALQNDITAEQTRAENAERALQTNIGNEVVRATSAETALQTAISNESTRAVNEESRIEQKLDNEITRENENYERLSSSISSEITRATGAENVLSTSIQNEERRASGEELGLRTALTAETVRATSAETVLQAANNILSANLTSEIDRAREAEANILSQIEDNELAFHDSATIDLVRTDGNPDIVVGHVKIANADNNIIKVDESAYGIYASVDLTYDSGRNILTFTTSDGTNKNLQLSEGSLIHNAWFDSATEELVFEMEKPDGSFYYVRVPVGSLFNQWDVDNSRSVAITLEKINGTGSGSTDLLTAKVNVSQADTNILEVRDNHLFVEGSGITKALSDIDVLNNNIEVFRTAVNGSSEGYTYPSHFTSHIISAATSYDEADTLLDAAFYEMMDKWFLLGFETCTTHTEVKEIGQNRHMLVDVRLSHGNKATGMTDEELSMTSMDDKYFSDTNVIRYINVTETRDHQHLDPDNGYNGIYLSNYWDCGKYYNDETESGEIEAMINDGFEVYRTNYKTDTAEGTSNYNYMNNVRQNDTL